VLSVGKIRELLGESARTAEDCEVEALRAQLYELAQHIVDAAPRGAARDRAARVESWRLTPPDRLAEVHERAAIMEFDGGLSRDEAERRAMEIVCGQQPEGVR
jgi:hypothetical protein